MLMLHTLPGPRSRGRSLLRTAVLALLGVTLAVLAFFFIAIALVAGACLALGIALRWWWVMRRLRAQGRAAGPLEGEYAVIEDREPQQRRR